MQSWQPTPGLSLVVGEIGSSPGRRQRDWEDTELCTPPLTLSVRPTPSPLTFRGEGGGEKRNN